ENDNGLILSYKTSTMSTPDVVPAEAFRQVLSAQFTQYDSSGYVSQTKNGLGRISYYTWDSQGRQTSISLPNPDPNTNAAGPSYYTAYDSLSNVVAQTDPAGKVTLSVYDSLNRLIQTIQPIADPTVTTPDYQTLQDDQFDEVLSDGSFDQIGNDTVATAQG